MRRGEGWGVTSCLPPTHAQGKIMEEVERYQGLSSDVDAQKTMWTNKRAAMVAAHGAYALQVRPLDDGEKDTCGLSPPPLPPSLHLLQLRGDYERQLNAARERRAELSDELEGVKRDWSETRKQVSSGRVLLCLA